MAELPDIAQEIKDAFAKEIKQYPCNSNWASKLGHPCLRHLVHWRLDWDKLPPSTDVVRQFIFNGGKVIERYIAKDYLEKAGYEIVENNKSVAWREKQIGANLDFTIRKRPAVNDIPVEVKGLQHYDWQKINCVEDFLESKKIWNRGYPAQLTIYMIQKSTEYGLFLLISKQTFEPKTIWVHLDYTYAESLVKKAEEINKHVASNTYPDRIDYAPYVCDKCDFQFLCMPDTERKGAEFIDSDEWTDKLKRYVELDPLTKEYESINEEIKDTFKEKDVIIGSDFRVTGGFRNSAKYDIPKDIKDKYKTVEPVWVKKVIDLRKVNP